MKKRLLSALLALTLIVGLLPGTVWASTTITPTSGTCGDNINWYLQQDGTLLLDGSGETYTYGGYWFQPPAPWSELADKIKTIKIQGNITYLGAGLFNECTSAVGITLPESLEYIHWGAWPDGDNLQFVVTGSTGRYIAYEGVLYGTQDPGGWDASNNPENAAFCLIYYPPSANYTSYTLRDETEGIISLQSKNLQKLTLNRNLKTINGISCPQLTELEIPNGVTEISSLAFSGCTSLRKLKLPSTISKLDTSIFWDCSSLESVVIPASVKEVFCPVYAYEGSTVDLTQHRDFYFCGDAPKVDNFSVADHITPVSSAWVEIRADIYYPQNSAGWTELIQNYGNSEYVKFYPYTPEETPPETPTRKYTVSYDLAGGSGWPSVGSYAAGEEVTIPTTVPVKDGYTFKWWQWSGAPVIYTPGQSFTMPEQNVSLTAQWRKKEVSDIDNNNVFIKQSNGSKCTLASATMMLRRRAILDGISDWGSITETSVGNSSWGKSKIWTNGGLLLEFEYRGMYTTAYVGENISKMALTAKKNYFITQLASHPEGIVVYRTWDGTQQHAVLLTGYDAASDTFYCVDPASSAKTGIIPLVDSTIRKEITKNKKQDDVLSVLRQVWIITKTSSQKTLVSSSVSAHCPVDMTITIGGETLDSRTVASREQNTYAEMTCSEVNGEKNIDVAITGDYVIRQDTDIKLYGSGSGSMTFEVKHYFSDGTSETHTFKDVPLTNASVGSATGIYPQSTVLLFMQEPAEEAETVWAASPNETVTEPCTDFGELPSDGNNNNSNNYPSISTNPYSPGIGGFAPSYSITAPSSITGGTVTVSPTSASTGSKVTITATPSSGYELNTLTATDSSGKVLTLINEGGGKYSFIMPNGKVSIDATFQVVETPWSNPFTDVSTGAWYYDAVKFVNQNGLMNGVGNGQFAPGSHLSRAMLAEILYNKEGRPAVTAASSFSDVGAGAWYTDAVTWAAANNIVGGYGNGRFGPGDDITREQFAVILYRYAGSPIPPNLWLDFTDAYKVSDWAQDAMRWAVDQGILKGKGDGILDPAGKATRAEAAQMLKNYLEP